MDDGRKSGRLGQVVEVGIRGQARYARMASGETIWWGSEEDVPNRVALAAASSRDAAGRGPATAWINGRAGSAVEEHGQSAP